MEMRGRVLWGMQVGVVSWSMCDAGVVVVRVGGRTGMCCMVEGHISAVEEANLEIPNEGMKNKG